MRETARNCDFCQFNLICVSLFECVAALQAAIIDSERPVMVMCNKNENAIVILPEEGVLANSHLPGLGWQIRRTPCAPSTLDSSD